MIEMSTRAKILVLLAVASAFAGGFFTPSSFKTQVKQVIGVGDGAVVDSPPPPPPNVRWPPTEADITALLAKIRSRCKSLTEAAMPIRDKLGVDERSLEVVIANGENPNAERCNMLRKRISGYMRAISQYDSLRGELSKKDVELCILLAEVKSSGAVPDDPQTRKLMNEASVVVNVAASEARTGDSPWEKEIGTGHK